MRSRGCRSLLFLLVLTTGCASDPEGAAPDASPVAYPTRSTAGETAGCSDGGPHRGLCRFITAVRAKDLTGFSEREREAAAGAGLLPDGDWYVASCTQLARGLFECRVPFAEKDLGVFEVVAVNGTTDEKGSYRAADELSPYYEVLQYRGRVPIT